VRVFQDEKGRKWEAVVGRESWGAFFAIFLPKDGDEAPRQTMMEAETMEGAMKALATMGEEELQATLARSHEKVME
jgi:hypothetical protein